MKKSIKKIPFIPAILITAMFLAACGETAPETAPADTAPAASETETAEISETELDYTPTTPEEFHRAMVTRSLYSMGDPTRLKAKIAKGRAGETVTMAFIGGSITEGVGGGNDGCYARLTADMFAEKFGCDVNYVNAGLSGTPSNLGVLRLSRDVLEKSPDIIFVEFAVNDSQDKIAKESYESLVKAALNAPGEPAVILLFNVTEEGYTAQAHMKQIGEFYELPMISAADALTAEFEEGRMTWQDYSDDHSHPNRNGHSLICEFVRHLFEAADDMDEPGEYTVKPGEVFGAPYADTTLVTPVYNGGDNVTVEETGAFIPVSSGTSGFPESWQLSGENGGSMKMTVNGNALFVIFKRDKSADRGSFDVYLDGEKLSTVNTDQPDGWGEAFSKQIIKFQTVREMNIEIRPTEGSEDKKIDILGIAVSR